MTGKNLHKTLVAVRWTARIIALLFTINFLFWNTFFAIGSAVVDLHGAITPVIILPVALGVLVLAAEIISWRKERIGGILFILSSAAYLLMFLINTLSGLRFAIITSIIKGFFSVWGVFGLPLLVAGILFLIAAQLSKKLVLKPALEAEKSK
jgi:hypothetical protein